MSKTIRLLLMTLPIVLGLVSCAEHDNQVDDNTTVIDPGSAEFNPEVLTMSTLYVADGVDADLHQAFKWGCATESSNPEDGWVLVLNKLTDVSEDVLKNALLDESPNYLICLLNPVKAEIDAYSEAHDWFYINTDDIGDDLLVFAFNGAGSRYFVHNFVEPENSDPILSNMNLARDYYVAISASLSDYAYRQQNGGKEDDNAKKMENFAYNYPISVTRPLRNLSHTFRELAWSDPDVLTGTVSMTALYDVYVVHVYEDQPGAGDYYGVKMKASVASAGMWKGKGWNRHGGTYVRWCGAYCKQFYVESRLVTSETADWYEDLNDRLSFTQGGYPSPATTQGETKYEDTNSFSLEMSQSVGASQKTKSDAADKKMESENEKHIELSFSEGWTWEHSETRSIKDVDIRNESYGNVAQWSLFFNNLPEYEWSQDYGFNEKNNQAARGTQILEASWMWYDKTGKDNEKRNPYWLCTWLWAEYEMQSFISTKADLKIDKVGPYDFWERHVMPVPENATGGHLVLVNNLPDGMALSDIKVEVVSNGSSKGVVPYEFSHTLLNGKEKEIGFFNNNMEYMVTFKAGKVGEQARTYKYTQNPTLKLKNREKVEIYALNDFTMQ